MKEFHKTMIETGELFETRRKQQKVWMWNHITQHILQVQVSIALCSWQFDQFTPCRLSERTNE